MQESDTAEDGEEGQDGDKAALNRVAIGTQLVSVWKDSRVLGKQAAEFANMIADGKALTLIDYEVRQVQRWPIANSPLGALLDPLADKLLLVTTFIVLTLPNLGLPNRVPLVGYAKGDMDYGTTIVRNFLYSALMALVWGVMSRLGAFQSGSAAGRGSGSVTSRIT